MARKTFNDKLHGSRDLPKVIIVEDEAEAKRLGGHTMIIPSPLQYDAVMKLIPKGKVVTATEIRAFLAKRGNADFACPLATGIFVNIVANASRERENDGSGDATPYWRTLKKDGELNEKYPDGIDGHRLLLELEGHEIIQKGKRYFVKDYQKVIYDLG